MAWWKERAQTLEKQQKLVPQLQIVNFKTENHAAYKKTLVRQLYDFAHGIANATSAFFQPTADNHSLDAELARLTVNTYHVKKKAPEKQDAMLFRLALTRNHLICQLTRLRNQMNTPLHVIVSSIVAFRNGSSKKVFEMMSRTHTWLSRKKTMDMIEELASLPPFIPFQVGRIGFCAYDNCSYYQKTSFLTVDKKHQFIHTVNAITIPLPETEMPPPGTVAWINRGDFTRRLFNYDNRDDLTVPLLAWSTLRDHHRDQGNLIGRPPDPAHTGKCGVRLCTMLNHIIPGRGACVGAPRTGCVRPLPLYYLRYPYNLSHRPADPLCGSHTHYERRNSEL